MRPTHHHCDSLFDRVIRHARKNIRIYHERQRAHQQQVTFGGGTREHLTADVARGVGAIVDDDLLAEQFAHLRCDQPRDQIDAAAGREGHDDTQRLGRKSIGLCRSAPGSAPGINPAENTK